MKIGPLPDALPGRRPSSARISPVRDLGIVLGRSVANLIPAVDAACAAGVTAESGHGLGFRHPLIRAVLYDEMPALVRAAWHRDAGRALPEAAAPGRPGGPVDATGGQRPRRA